MLSLYEILKASKTSIAPDMWTALAGANFGGAGSGAEIKELTGIPPLSIRSNGTMLLDYLISGNMSQTGTPTHTTPIQPQETGERTGNLWDGDVPKYVYAKDYKKYNPDNAIALKSGTYTISSDGKLPIIQVFDANHTQLNVDDTITHTSGYYKKIWNGLAIGPQLNAIREITITLSSDYILTFTVDGNSGTYIMLNTGSTALPYEPYGYKLPISSAGQTNSIYLGEVQTTRRIKKLVLTGEETLTSGSIIGQIRTPLTGAIESLGLCTHYILKTSYGGAFPYIRIRSNTLWFEISPDGYETKEEAVTEFKAYLAQQYAAGTPVTVWYVLATEETGIVNEPIRKIGNYADCISMEQAGVQIPTNRGNTVIDVLTELKPSQMYIKYQE